MDLYSTLIDKDEKNNNNSDNIFIFVDKRLDGLAKHFITMHR